ncbi:ankyrin repeat domain-containing protein 27-like [Corticium candelabrum]|uniref:ankyrin repeat domain-containing protein 27-like n=1 Tax=Corticium candelabrum TaxID=121492 RepID=UPI002E263A6B|nr:ankyrin repeat domain-containing protein 27-like [Corticium candelabrum]
MSGYDEDIYENPFFQALNNKHASLYEQAAIQRWMILIPRIGSAGRLSLNKSDFETHVVHPIDRLDDVASVKTVVNDGAAKTTDTERVFVTMNKKELNIVGDEITTGSGFRERRVVKVLFEETFFNLSDESFKVLCIEQPLEGAVVDDLAIPSLETLRDCVRFLFADSGNKRIQRTVDEILDNARASIKFFHGQSIRHPLDATTAVFARVMQIVLKDSTLKKPAIRNKAFMTNVKISMETYVMARLHSKIFNGVCSLVSSDDSAVNKTTRNLLDLQLRELGVRVEAFPNLSAAREMLSQLNKFETPLEKLCCLKRTVVAISSPSSGQTQMVTADDLLPMLVFLVVKSEIPNWLGNLIYMHNFSLAGSLSEEFRYILSSFEAAVQHIKEGHLSNRQFSVRQRILDSPTKAPSAVPWQSLDNPDGVNGFSAVDRLFSLVARNAVQDVAAMLAVSTLQSQDNITAQLCHPLCSCDKCEKLVARTRNDLNAVTVFSRDDRGCTSLHVAAQEGYTEVMTLLIERQAQVNAADFHGSTPLHVACLRGNQKAAILLIDRSASVNVITNDGNLPLHLCCMNGHEECAKVFFFHAKQSVDVSLPNEHGDTALHNAAKWGYVGIVQLLLDNGASPQALNRRKETPFQCSHSPDVLQLLQEADTHDDYVHCDQEIPIGINVLRINKKGSSQHRKTQASRQHIQSNLGSSLGKKSTVTVGELSPHELEVQRLIQACTDGDIQMVQFKLGWVEDEVQDAKNASHLCHPLCQCNSCIKIKEQINQHVVLSMDECDLEGRTVLHVASICGHRNIVLLLLKRGAAVNPKNKLKQTPLHLACQYNHQDIVMLLIEYGARVSARDERGNTPLHFCCSNGHDASAAILLFHDAPVNAANNHGNTPLHNAARWGHPTLVSTLLHHGAVISLKNSDHLTPSQLTQNDDVIDLLDRAHRGEIKIGVYARRVSHALDIKEQHTLSPSQSDQRLRAASVESPLSRSFPGLAVSSSPVAGTSASATVDDIVLTGQHRRSPADSLERNGRRGRSTVNVRQTPSYDQVKNQRLERSPKKTL